MTFTCARYDHKYDPIGQAISTRSMHSSTAERGLNGFSEGENRNRR
jgi:hypothetical protein